MDIQFNPVQLNSIQAFVNIHSRRNAAQRQVYFLRAEGAGADLLTDISNADRFMRSAENTVYCRLVRLSSLTDTEKVGIYLQKYNDLRNGKDILFPQYPEISSEIANALRKLFSELRTVKPDTTDTAERNMAVQLLYRTEKYLLEMLTQRKDKFCKLIYSGCHKTSEFLFGYLAVLLGIDTLILMPEGEGSIPVKLMQNCASISYGAYGHVEIPEYQPNVIPEQKKPTTKQKVTPTVKLHIPQHPNRKTTPVPKPSSEPTVRQERSYEELASLAESVVMIIIQDEKGEPFASGSGIAIHRDGYILTNCHVIQGGRSFCIRIENDDRVYDTVDVIKYHPQFDLALLRIHREMPPLPVFDDRRQLRRGEKVFSIGSPMGLFNSVSDGIISGFREIRDREMIQFTAPISHGSSGGALLNCYGEVIGICTSGIDEGQNLNLAVSYKHILSFASNVLQKIK